MPQIRGDAEQIIGAIQLKTGESREAIERYLQEVSGNAASAIGAAAETVRDYALTLPKPCSIRPSTLPAGCAHGYNEAERFVRDRPGESLLVCFGVGLIAGVVIALSLRSR